jgi:hypothetical protein
VLPSGGHHAHVTAPDAWLAAVTPWLPAAAGAAASPGGTGAWPS